MAKKMLLAASNLFAAFLRLKPAKNLGLKRIFIWFQICTPYVPICNLHTVCAITCDVYTFFPTFEGQKC